MWCVMCVCVCMCGRVREWMCMFVGCVHMCVCCMDVCVCEFTVHVRVWHMCGMCASVCVCVQRVRKCIFKLLVTSSSSAVARLSTTDIPLGIRICLPTLEPLY